MLPLQRSVALAILTAGALSACVVPPPAPPPQPPSAWASAPPPMYFYPERGQSEAQQDRDRYECYRWAVSQSGFDPGMTPVTMSSTGPTTPAPRDGSAVAAGAATGAVVGAVTSRPRHALSGAVIGAIFGATIGAIAQESRAQAIEREQANRERSAALAQIDGFRRAMSACMAARGYRVA